MILAEQFKAGCAVVVNGVAVILELAAAGELLFEGDSVVVAAVVAGDVVAGDGIIVVVVSSPCIVSAKKYNDLF